MSGKVAVVTGSNKGIGYAIVRNLCSSFEGAVYLTCRNVERGKKAVEDLEKEGFQPMFHQLDIDDERSVESFYSYLKDKYGGLDCLVNNAGIAFKQASTEPISVQAKETVKTNYFGTLRACKILFPLLREHARVVNVSSVCGFLHNIPGQDLQRKLSSPDLTEAELTNLMEDFVKAAEEGKLEERGWPSSSYNVSKVGVSALTRVQQKEFDKCPQKDIIINHVHPGYVNTDMTSHKGPLTIEEGAVSPTYAALLPPNVKKPKGDYLWHDKQIVDWVKGPLPSAY